MWLSQEQLSQLFGRERSVITKHLRNVFAEGELGEESNVQNLHIAGSDKPAGWGSQLLSCVRTIIECVKSH